MGFVFHGSSYQCRYRKQMHKHNSRVCACQGTDYCWYLKGGRQFNLHLFRNQEELGQIGKRNEKLQLRFVSMSFTDTSKI